MCATIFFCVKISKQLCCTRYNETMQEKNEMKKASKRIYLDNAASTSVDERVVEAMLPYFRDAMGNPGSLHSEGLLARDTLREAREKMASFLHTVSESIVFTSCGTESNNLAILGVAEALRKSGKKYEDMHFITSEVEHSSVTRCFSHLEELGAHVTYVPVDGMGRIDPILLKEAITPKTVLLSTMYVNNEVGTIEHIEAISSIVRAKRSAYGIDYPLFHTDASQAPVWLSLNVQKLGVDFLTLDSQKMYGPKGIGCLFVKNRETLSSVLFGGGQEFGLRPGTPPIPLVVGFVKAFELLEEERESYVSTIERMRDMLIEYVLSHVQGAQLLGDTGKGRVQGNASFLFPNVDDEQVVIELDVRNVAVSAKSACLTEEGGGSTIVQKLLQVQEGDAEVRGILRVTLSKFTTEEEVREAGECIVDTVLWLSQKH